MQTDFSHTQTVKTCFFGTVLPLLLLAAKLWAVTTGIVKAGNASFVLLCFSLFLVTALPLLFRLVFRKSHVPLLMTLYTVLSVVFFIDAVYSGYTGKLPSAVMLRYTWQLGDVSDTILDNVTLPRILYILDLPLWLLYAVHKPKREKNGGKANDRLPAVLLGALSVCAGGVCLVCCVTGAASPSYFRSEIISYHILDVGATLFPQKETSVIFDAAVLSGTETDSAGADTVSEDALPAGAETSPYYGIANGRNVITIQVEALQNFVLGTVYNGQELTPNLNAMLASDTLYFDRYYYQIGGGNTADAEFTVNNSLYAPEEQAAYEKYGENDYYSMATLLKDNGYTTATAFHGYIGNYWYRDVAYPGQGFDTFLSGSDYYASPTETAGSLDGVSDAEFFSRAVDYLQTQESPFYAFLVTLSSHYSYDMEPQYRTLTLAPEDEGTLFGDYLVSIHYVDAAFGVLINRLKEAGLYDTSVITIYGDHFALPVYNGECKKAMTKLLGKEYTYAEHFHVPLIVHIPGCGMTETISNVGGHIDVMPTLLHLLGLENEKGIMLGYNILTTEDGIVYEQTHLARGSFIMGNVLYQYPFNGIAANATANAIDTWEKLDAAQYLDIAKEGQNAYAFGMYLLDNNLVLKERYKEATG